SVAVGASVAAGAAVAAGASVGVVLPHAASTRLASTISESKAEIFFFTFLLHRESSGLIFNVHYWEWELGTGCRAPPSIMCVKNYTPITNVKDDRASSTLPWEGLLNHIQMPACEILYFQSMN